MRFEALTPSRFLISCGAGVIAATLSVGGVAAPAGAEETFLPGISGLCGTAVLGAMPTSLQHGVAVNRAVQVFPEQSAGGSGSGFTLTSPVAVDVAGVGTYDRPSALPSPQPMLSAASGTLASWLVHWDPPGDPNVASRRTVTIGFSARIVGVQVLSSIVGSIASQQFQRAGVTYPVGASGLQLAANGTGDVLRVPDPFTVSLSFTGLDTVKEFRAITGGVGAAMRYPGFLSAGPPSGAGLPHGSGYSMLAGDGGVFVFSPDSGYWGSLGATRLNQPVTAGARTCSGEGYWLTARDGGMFSFGDATFHGSLGDRPPSSPVVAMATTPTGEGYDLVTATGQVTSFGDAHFYGDTRTLPLNEPIVGITTTPTGNGYWLVASDGGIFAFGDASFDGSTGGIHLNRPIVAMRASPTGDGYYLLASDGGIFTFASSRPFTQALPFYGSAGASADPHPFVGMRLAADGRGYWLTDSAGKVFGFGPSSPSAAGVSGVALATPIIGML